jgi:hypothetical protein
VDDITVIRLTSLLEEKKNWFQGKADITNGTHEIFHDITSQLADFFEQFAAIIREGE